MLNPQLTERAAEFWSDRQLQQFNDAVSAEADRAELVAAMAKERLKAKIAALSDDDLIGGLHSVTQQKHGAALRAAFRESPEALGDLVMSIIVHAMSEDAELEAERSLDDERPRFANVSCSQCGQCFGPGNAGFGHCTDHIGRRVRLFDEI
ncbi:cytochrome P450 [Burkholderia cenocepacia]|uniref:cytochrome P450 n=1 Tax=Burkholderia cenocepacia TaxID=95486 RepID=UPI001CF45F6C|nr:cytochrome P450 [Burkholderia cenocepacia]MCA7962525.1 cytochrome P450 [Burkholderia cenocepacia]